MRGTARFGGKCLSEFIGLSDDLLVCRIVQTAAVHLFSESGDLQTCDEKIRGDFGREPLFGALVVFVTFRLICIRGSASATLRRMNRRRRSVRRAWEL